MALEIELHHFQAISTAGYVEKKGTHLNQSLCKKIWNVVGIHTRLFQV